MFGWNQGAGRFAGVQTAAKAAAIAAALAVMGVGAGCSAPVVEEASSPAIVPATADDGTLYVLTSSTLYNDAGDPYDAKEYVLDDRGNVLEMDQKLYAYFQEGTASPAGPPQWHFTYELDENGYEVGCLHSPISKDGSEGASFTSATVAEVDDEGRLLSETTTNDATVSTSTTTYSYRSDGSLEGTVLNYESTPTSGYTVTSAYDENGLLVKRVEETGQGENIERSELELVWDFDDSGAPLAYTVTRSESSATYTVETDDAGNIIAVYDEDGDLRAEYAYEPIEDPSAAVRVYAAIEDQLPLS